MTDTPDLTSLERWTTFREAMAQPRIWRNWSAPLRAHAAAVAAWMAEADYDELWFCGAGSSAFIGDTLAAALAFPRRRPVCRSVPTTDFVSGPGRYLVPDRRVLVVSFGRSGSSSETVGMLDLLDRWLPRADRLNITCNGGSTLATRPPRGPGRQYVIALPPETHDGGFAMTSSFTTMLLSALACLDPAPPLPVADALGRLAQTAEAVLNAALREARRAEVPGRIVYLGSGVLTAAARECALKTLELTRGRVPSVWDSALGFRHGPKAFVDAQTRVYLLVSNDPLTRRYDLDLADEVRRQFGARTVVTLGADHDDADIEIQEVGNDAWTSVLYVLAGQMQAIAWSDALGIDVDNPFKEGNLTRVVSGVTLYPYETVAR